MPASESPSISSRNQPIATPAASRGMKDHCIFLSFKADSKFSLLQMRELAAEPFVFVLFPQSKGIRNMYSFLDPILN